MRVALIGGALIALGLAAPASAATFIVTNGGDGTFVASQTTSLGDKLLTFDGANPTGVTSTLSNASVVQGSLSGQYAQPFGSDGSKYLSVFGTDGSATIADTSGAGYNALSLYLGSIDTYNTIELLSNVGAVIASYAGSAFLGGPSGDQGLPTTNRLITFTRNGNDALFAGVRISSTQNSAEVDNVRFSSVSAPVPEPATWAMMLVGFGLVGGALRRRTKVQTRVRFAY